MLGVQVEHFPLQLVLKLLGCFTAVVLLAPSYHHVQTCIGLHTNLTALISEWR